MREDEVGLMLFPGKAVAVELNRWLRNSARHCAKAVPNPHKACEAVASPPPAEPWQSVRTCRVVSETRAPKASR